MVLTAEDFAFFVTENELDPNLVLQAPSVRLPSFSQAYHPLAQNTFSRSSSLSNTGYNILCHPAAGVWRRSFGPAHEPLIDSQRQVCSTRTIS